MGVNLGIAFQIKDDLLGLYSDDLKMGKTLNDIKENKQTIIYKYAIDHANKEDLEYIKKYYGNKDINGEQTSRLLEIFEKTKAKENAEKLVNEYTNKGIDIINSMNVTNKEIFIDFANYLLKREN